jgi:hypothetical protein
MILSVSVIEDISGFLSASAGGRWPAAKACWPPPNKPLTKVPI